MPCILIMLKNVIVVSMSRQCALCHEDSTGGLYNVNLYCRHAKGVNVCPLCRMTCYFYCLLSFLFKRLFRLNWQFLMRHSEYNKACILQQKVTIRLHPLNQWI